MKRGQNIIIVIIAALAVAAAFAASFGVLLFSTLDCPDSWHLVKYGQTREEAHAECPGVSTGLFGAKGDWWYVKRPLGRWQMQVSYDEQQRVCEKHLMLELGSKDYFHRVHFL
jgi:hypothetical protein